MANDMANDQATIRRQLDADFRQHEETYGLFIGLAKWGVIACIAILVFMAIFLL